MKNCLGIFFLLCLNPVFVNAANGRDPCQHYKTSILWREQRLVSCLNGRSVENYTVSFGANGLQIRLGDKKTLWGALSWADPVLRDLHLKRLFQSKFQNGWAAVGIHGPSRSDVGLVL